MLDAAVPFGRDLWRRAAAAQILPDHIALVALVAAHESGLAVAYLHKHVVV